MRTNISKIANIIVFAWIGCAQGIAQTNLSEWWLNEHGVPQWGVATNFLRPGLGIKYMGDTNHSIVQCKPLMQYIGPDKNFTNMIRMVFLPPPWRYRMTLLDEKGNVVEKTAAGESMGRPLATRPRISVRNGYRPLGPPLRQNGIAMLDPFILQDYFKIDQPGKYHMQLTIHGVTDTGPTNHIPLSYSVNAEIEIQKP